VVIPSEQRAANHRLQRITRAIVFDVANQPRVPAEPQRSSIKSLGRNRVIGVVRRLEAVNSTVDLLNSEPANLAEIYDACQTIDLANLRSPSKEMGFLCLAMHRMAQYVNELGHDGSRLHSAVTNYLIDLTRHADITIAVTATYALADHGAKPDCVANRLTELVIEDRRGNDHPIVTLRGVAIRMIKRLDPEIAAAYVDSTAFEDYRRTVNHWLASGASMAAELNSELQAELHWIKLQEDRRTKR